jgi:quercetin dioxygenase-like cupin family protein
MDRSTIEPADRGARPSVRAEHALAGPLLTFDLAAEFARLRAEPPYADHRRNAKTLVKSDSFRIVAVALRAGIRFDADHPRGHVGLVVHEGAVTLHVDGREERLATGGLGAIEPGNRWWAEADEDSLLLLHLGWPR